MSNREVTLFDVAKGTGVSLAAASRALNGKNGVRVEVHEHIQSVADELNYRPNRAAHYLAGGRTGVVGLLLGTEYPASEALATQKADARIRETRSSTTRKPRSQHSGCNS